MNLPETEDEFDALMHEVDAALKHGGVPISHRPMASLGYVARRFGVSMAMGDPRFMPPHVRPYAAFGERMNEWFKSVYGDKLKIDMTVGRIVVSIEDDLYVMTMPGIMGRVNFFASRTFIPRDEGIGRNEKRCNVLQLVKGLTQKRAAQMSDQEISDVYQMFDVGLRSLDMLKSTQGSDLTGIAYGDVVTAVNCLIDPNKRFAESKWASLQAAEKTLKAAIEFEGHKYKGGHDLSQQSTHLASIGVACVCQDLTDSIQCSAGFRYGTENCSQDEALEAHHASLKLVLRLKSSGAKFASSLAGP